MTIFNRAFALAAVTCLAAAPVTAGEVHRWIDADGRVQYGDKPPPGVATREIAAPAAASGGAKPAPEVRVETSVLQFYDISGATFAELNAAAQQSGPVSKTTGKRVWGMCTWRVTSNYSSRQEPGRCVIENFTVTVGAAIDFPRWTNRKTASADLQGGWDRFAAALRLHEDGHKDIGVRAANDLANRLRALPPERNCAVLDQKVTELGERVLAQYQSSDQAYDRSTDNGATQGAMLK